MGNKYDQLSCLALEKGVSLDMGLVVPKLVKSQETWVRLVTL